MEKSFSILINTTDKFDDCWQPFFKLFSLYWPEYKGKIYLNTEYKSYSYEGLDIISVKNNSTQNKAKKTWSECLIDALNTIEDDVVLYMQEDYFLKSPVQHAKVLEFVNIVYEQDIDCIHLTDQNSAGPFSPSAFTELWKIEKNAAYRVSCQAALWRKKTLLQYIKPYENPWQFEKYATKRSRIIPHNFYCVNREVYKLNKNEIVPYFFTGIVHGRWLEGVEDLFAKHDIIVDFSKRGFFKQAPPRTLQQKLSRLLKNAKGDIRSSLNLFYLALKVK